MIPPILQRLPLRTGFTNAYYNPHTLIFRGPHDTCLVDNAEIDWEELIKMQGTYGHEFVHWNQYNGTTVGAFLTFLRYSQQITTLNLFTSLPQNLKERLLYSRRHGNPVVPINKKGLLGFSDEGSSLNIFRQIWYDHILVQSLIENSTLQQDISWPIGQVFGEVASDVILFSCDEYKFDTYAGHEEVRQWYKFDGPVHLVSSQGRRLTSKLLMEGSAVCSELLILSRLISDQIIGKNVNRDFFTQRLLDILRGDYGLALNLMLESFGYEYFDITSVLSTFSTLCDIALNPPLPPIFMSPPINKKSWQWEEIYPPLRFLAAVNSLPDIGLLPDSPTPKVLNQYIEDICDYNNWPSPTSYIHPYKISKTYTDFSKIPEIIPQNSLTYHDYILWVQSKMWELRRSLPHAFTCFADCMIGDYSRNYAELTFKDGDSRWSRPLMQWTPEDDIGYTDQESHFGDWLLISSAAHYSMFDIMCRSDSIDFTPYPPGVISQPNFSQSIVDSLTNSLGVNLFI